MRGFWYFMVQGYSMPVGYVIDGFVREVEWPSCWSLDFDRRTLTLHGGETFDQRTQHMQQTLRSILKQRKALSSKWSNEDYPVYHGHGSGEKKTLEHVMDMDRCGLEKFGIRTYGVHLTAWMKVVEDGKELTKYVVPRRAKDKRIYPSLLDNSVGGGLGSQDQNSPFDGMVREIEEEAGIPPSYSRQHLKQCDVLSYSMATTNWGHPGWQHNTLYVFEMELTEGMLPEVNDGEVEAFYLMTLEEVQTELFKKSFLPTGTMTWIAYLIRHGHLNSEDVKDLPEITARLHRKHDLFIL